MKVEIEAKLRIPDLDQLITRLKQLDAPLVATMLECNIFLDANDRRLNTTDRGLRVREIHHDDGAASTVITFKGPRSLGQLKTRREIEFTIDNTEAALNLLGELGYHETIRFEKRRARYRYDGCNVELDEMPYLGNFIEIEGPDDRTVLQAIKALGLGDRPLIRSSYVAMLLTWLQEHSIDDRNIRFNSAQPNAAPLKARS